MPRLIRVFAGRTGQRIGLDKQCRPRFSRNSLIRVYTVCHSVCIVWTHYSMVESHSSNFRVITTNILGVRIFRKFTGVCMYIISLNGFICLIPTIVIFLFYFVCIEEHMGPRLTKRTLQHSAICWIYTFKKKVLKITIFYCHSQRVQSCVMHSSISYLLNLQVYWAKLEWLLP